MERQHPVAPRFGARSCDSTSCSLVTSAVSSPLMLGLFTRQLRRRLRRGFRALGPRQTRRWRLPLGQWAGANVKAVLKSEKGEARLDQLVTELARRLAPVLSRLDEGAAVLDD